MSQRFGTPTALRQRITQVREMDRITMAIIAAVAALGIAIVFPWFIPAAKHGVDCYSLPAPIGGNNRSLLAQVGHDTQNLKMEMVLDSDTVGLNQNLKGHVTFVNSDIGPVILFLAPRPLVITTNTYQVGLRFQLASVSGTTTIDQGVLSQPWNSGAGFPRTNEWANPTYLHLLGSRSRCTVEFSFNLQQLSGGTLPTGDYRVQASYYNNNIGSTRPASASFATVTATAAYVDQGLWTGEINSQEVRFTLGGP
jgi:hypothetical protein